MSKHYVITLNLVLGEYEKTTHDLISSDNENTAGTQALIQECHDEPDFDLFPDKQSCWDCGEMLYQVGRVTELNQEDYESFKRIITGVLY